MNEETGEIVDVSESVPGSTADITLLRRSELMKRLPPGGRGIGDLAYAGIAQEGRGSAPRRKPYRKPRPFRNVAYNAAFSRRRIIVEHR